MKNEIAKIWIELAILTGKQLTQSTVEMLIKSVADLPQQEVLKVLTKWPETERTFPLPADIRQKITPEINESDDVQESVNRIITATSKYGYTNSSEARKFIGELGWQIVNGTGGWKNICENLTADSIGIYRAQLRDYGLSVWKRAKRGELNEAPALPITIKNMLPKLEVFE